jgi:endoglucanase
LPIWIRRCCTFDRARTGHLLDPARFAALLLVLATCPALRPAPSEVLPPLHTSGYQILDARNRVVRLASVNWYGFDQREFVAGGLDRAPLAKIIEQIRAIGANSVRLPWANETVETNPLVQDYAIKANPQFRGKRAMEVMDAVIEALAEARIMVILDNHVSRADWCCKDDDGNGLWYSREYPEERWLADWQVMALRYRKKVWVVGADLRNELRSGATWGGTDPQFDWRAAAERGGNRVLGANPNLLVMVEGPQYSTDFTAFASLPLVLKIPNRLVYSPHAYSSPAHTFASYEELQQVYDARAGFLLQSTPPVPLWVGEFGACQNLECGAESQWFLWFVRYLKERNLSWGYWPLNGTQSSGYSRTYDALESFGLLSTDYQRIAAPKIVELLRTVEPPAN